MVSPKTLVTWLSLFLTFLVSNSLTAHTKISGKVNYSLPKNPSSHDHGPYKFAKEFCNKRTSSKEVRDFCNRVLQKNRRSKSEMIGVISDVITIAEGLIGFTKGFVDSLLNNGSTKKEFLPALKQCVSNYNTSVGKMQNITKDMADDPALASYDARMAHDELDNCENALKPDNVLADDLFFWSKHEIAKARVILIEQMVNMFN